MTEAEAFLASIRTRVGQIQKAQRTPTADAWGQIEVACDKLLDAAKSFERSLAVSRSGCCDTTASVPCADCPRATVPR